MQIFHDLDLEPDCNVELVNAIVGNMSPK